MPEDSSFLMSSRTRRDLTLSPEDLNPSTGSRSPPNHFGGGSQQRNTPGKLAQEIHDEFLICKICLDSYKNPKCLACLHTFCEMCIDNHVISEASYKKYCDYRDFTCPLCRKRTQLPIGGVKKLPDNFLVSSLSEMVDRQKPGSKVNCEICALISKQEREACSKCLECNKHLCQACVELHKNTKVTRDHSIFDVNIEKDVVCKQHDEEVVRFYCEPCEACICVLCTFNEHRGHEVTSFGEASGKYKASIEGLLENCKDNIGTFEANIEHVGKTQKIIRETEQKIHDLAIDFISEIRQREKLMIEEIHNIYGPQTMALIEKVDEMESQVQTLRSTCSLTEVVLHGRDIELLLLKKNVEEKLGVLSKAASQSLPSTIKKEIRFLPGQLDLGCVQDMDRPVSTSSRLSKSRPESYADIYQNSTNGVQTQTSQESSENPSSENDPCSGSPHLTSMATGTDPLIQLDKGVNTRSRSLQHAEGSGAPRQRRRQRNQVEQPAEMSPPTTGGEEVVSDSFESTTESGVLVPQDLEMCSGDNEEDNNTTYAEFILNFD